VSVRFGGVDADALHDAVVPPFVPVQDRVQGPVPATALAVPTLQRLVVGRDGNVCPFADPQTQLVGGVFSTRSHIPYAS
jgi:hypothetical protein